MQLKRKLHNQCIEIQHCNVPITGATCTDTQRGAQCGDCPAGYTGDGQRCRPEDACRANPCFPGQS